MRSTLASSPVLITTPGYSKATLMPRSGLVSFFSFSSAAKAGERANVIRVRVVIIDSVQRVLTVLLFIVFLLRVL
jgi:hypothetical protein